MGIFSKNEPLVLKEGSSAKKQLEELESLRGTLSPSMEKQLEADIRAVQAGIAGEERILFELRNSHMDMVILQDLYLEHRGLTAQIDFLVLTRQRNYVIECKNLYGNIEVNERGDFVRTFGGRKREGIYSPITQNQRHIDLIHAMKREDRDLFTNLLVDGDFDDTYQSLIVLANPKTILDDQDAPQAVRDRIVRVDQLVTTIRKINNKRGPGRDKVPFSLVVQKAAPWFLERNKDNPIDYLAKYHTEAPCGEPSSVEAPVSPPVVEWPIQPLVQQREAEPRTAQALVCPRCGGSMVLRRAKRGAHKGEQFYGCENYPRCRYIISIDSE